MENMITKVASIGPAPMHQKIIWYLDRMMERAMHTHLFERKELVACSALLGQASGR